MDARGRVTRHGATERGEKHPFCIEVSQIGHFCKIIHKAIFVQCNFEEKPRVVPHHSEFSNTNQILTIFKYLKYGISAHLYGFVFILHAYTGCAGQL